MSMPAAFRSRPRRAVVGLAAAAAAVALTLAGCSGGADSGKTVITLAGPNQWNADTKSFGPAWDKLVAAFEKDNPSIEVKTNVLPLSSWASTTAAQLTAGTAPELIFNQAAHKPAQVVDLTPYLEKKNPYASTSTWIGEYDPAKFGDAQRNGEGHFEYVPFNLVAVGIFYNKDLLSKAGVDVAQLSTFDGFTRACSALKAKGINPLGTDNGTLAPGWTSTAIQSMLLQGLAKKVNAFGADGKAGTADPVTAKSWAKAILDGSLDLRTSPEVAGVVKTLKTWTDACATPNWSGVASQGAFTGGAAFPAGKAAMAWGTDFSSAGLADASFRWGTVTFPTMSSADSSSATGKPAQFGVTVGGTSYMIPAYIKGAKRSAAVRFLQYVSSPKGQGWLDETGAIPAISGVKAPTTIAALTSAEWATPSTIGPGPFGLPAAANNKTGVDGYLLGSKSLDEYLASAQDLAVQWAHEQATQNSWTDLG
jgi:ABC-type glycerol-3-phosphate transport system substrate-binding protein